MYPSNATSIQEWQRSGQSFDFCGQSIFYQIQGKEDAPTLLLIHGYPSASWDWHLQWPTLIQKFRVITLDMLGFGFSDKPSSFPKDSTLQYSIHTQANIISALLQKLSLTSVHILSHDYGDTVAQELLARSFHKEPQAINILSLCLLNGGIFPETHQALFLQKILLSPLGPLVARLGTYKKFKKTFDYICEKPLDEQDISTLWDLVNFNKGKPVLAKLIGYMQERKKYRERWVGALQKTDIAIRLIDGLQDPISGAHMVKRYRELILNADIIELQGVGHYPQLEAPELVLESFLSFHKLQPSCS
jgi:pimeloyl-ACP methyl ester carboxylesterase